MLKRLCFFFSWIGGVSSPFEDLSSPPPPTHHPNIQLRCVTHLACSPELNCVMNHMWKCSLCCLEFSPSPIQIFTLRLFSSSAGISPHSTEQVWKHWIQCLFVWSRRGDGEDKRSRAALSLCYCCGVFYREWRPLLKKALWVSALWSHRVRADLQTSVFLLIWNRRVQEVIYRRAEIKQAWAVTAHVSLSLQRKTFDIIRTEIGWFPVLKLRCHNKATNFMSLWCISCYKDDIKWYNLYPGWIKL